MPNQADFEQHRQHTGDLHIYDKSREHIGGREPLWFPFVVFLVIAASGFLACEMLWKMYCWVFQTK